MDIWSKRNEALTVLDNDIKKEKEVLEEGFAVLDQCIHCFHMHMNDADNTIATFAAYCCATLVKIRRLALGSYSLCLDGLAFEAGALMRSLIEGLQILIFFQQQPESIALAEAENMPQAGDIAKAINGELHSEIRDILWEQRKHYNQFSSHFSLKQSALQPIETTFDLNALKRNMRSLFSTINLLAYISAMCLSIIGLKDIFLNESIETFREKGSSIFGAYEDFEN